VLLFFVVVPVAVLVINVIVLRQVRRAANNAAANLGLQQHQQSTSSNSAVPTAMLVTTSIVYVLFSGATHVIEVIRLFAPLSPETKLFLARAWAVTENAQSLVFAYNFYVYLITGKQFRSELRKLFCRLPSASAAATTSIRLSEQSNAETRV